MSTKSYTDLSNDDAIKAAAARDLARQALQPAEARGAESASTGVDLNLPDGRVVTMGTPVGGTIRRIALILGSEPNGNIPILMGWLKSLMYVRAIDGHIVPSINNMTDAQKLSDILGDQGEEVVMLAYQENWPSLTAKELPIIKK